MWNSSPLGLVDPMTLAEILGKVKGMLSNHANNQKSLASLFEVWKCQVDREQRGRATMAMISGSEVLSILMCYTDRCIADVGGYKQWEGLSDVEKECKQCAAHVQVA